MIFLFIICGFVLFLVSAKLYHMIFQASCTSKVSLIGKTALVTGGASGIGYQIVLGLAARGCKVIVADRNIHETIRDAAYNETNNPNIIFKYIDLASFKSVRKFAEDIKKSEDKIDILINNAGIAQGTNVKTEDDIGITMQVNYYSAFLLTHLLLDLLKHSSAGRVIFTTSMMSCIVPLIIGNVEESGIETGRAFFSYPISKFCQICASESFAEKLKNYKVTSNCFHPYTAAKTNIFNYSVKGSSWYDFVTIKFLDVLAQITGKTAEEAAQTGIYLACAKEVENVTGEFFGNLKPTWKPFKIKNEKFRKAIWDHSERVVKLKPEERIK